MNKYEFAVELEVMREGMNRNRWNYRNMQDNYLTFLGTPILVAYVNGQVGDGHNMREKVNPRTGRGIPEFYRCHVGAHCGRHCRRTRRIFPWWRKMDRRG